MDPLGEYDIDFGQVCSATADAGSNIHKAHHENFLFAGACFAHIIDNVLKYTFQDPKLPQEIQDLLQSCQHICRSFHHSYRLSEYLDENTLAASNSTRWNSNIYTVMSVKNAIPQINRAAADFNMDSIHITAQKKDRLSILSEFLNEIQQVLVRMQGNEQDYSKVFYYESVLERIADTFMEGKYSEPKKYPEFQQLGLVFKEHLDVMCDKYLFPGGHRTAKTVCSNPYIRYGFCDPMSMYTLVHSYLEDSVVKQVEQTLFNATKDDVRVLSPQHKRRRVTNTTSPGSMADMSTVNLSPEELFQLSSTKRYWRSQRPRSDLKTPSLEYWTKDKERQKSYPHIATYVQSVGPTFLTAASVERVFSILGVD